MGPTANPCVLFVKAPVEFPVAGEHLVYTTSSTIDLDAPLQTDTFLTKTLLLSPEPYMRDRMRDPSIADSYSTPMKKDQPVVGLGLVLVLRSSRENVNEGDYMFGFTPWEAYTVQPYTGPRVEYKGFPSWTIDMDRVLGLQRVPNPQGAFPWTRYCSCLGTPGRAAYIGLEQFAPDAKAGQTIYVSSGASGVGMMVIQLAKLKGLKTIASAGTDEKVKLMRSLGADVAFNYATTPVGVALASHGPIDFCFDNVGGEQLEAVLENMNMNGRVISCGAISEYNLPPDQRYGIKNLSLLFKRRIRLEGFIISDTPEYYPRFEGEIVPMLVQGKLTANEQLFEGLESGPEAFASLFNGKAKSKVVVVVDPKYAA